MTVTAVGLVVNALVDALDAASDAADGEDLMASVTVSDGYGDWSGNTGAFLLIGVEDPELEGAANSASAQQSWAHVNHTSRDEDGTVTCAAWSRNGDAGAYGQRKAREEAIALASTVGRLCRLNPTLDVPCLLWSSFGTSVDVNQNQYEDGSSALVVFQVAYRARLTSDGD